MGQKTKPTVLRLEKTNQHFKACWYSNYFYSDQLHNNFKIRDYICKIFNRINRCTPLIYIKNGHQSNQILCFFLKKRIRRFKNFKQKRLTPHLRWHSPPSKKWSAFFGVFLRNKIKSSLIKTQNNVPYPTKNVGLCTNSLSTYTPGNLPPTIYPVEKLFYVHNLLSQEKKDKKDKKDKVAFSRQSQDKINLSTLILGCFHKQSHLLLSTKKTNSPATLTPALVASGSNSRKVFTRSSTKIKHKTRIENTINFSNFRSLTVVTDSQKIGYNPVQKVNHGNLPWFAGHREYGVTDNNFNTFWDNPCHIPKVRGAHSKEGRYFGQDDCQTRRKKTTLYPIKVSKVQQNSDFLAQKIASALKRRVTYNRLRRQILRDVVKSKFVKGIRVTLSGRVESKSKKAQKARTNTFHWGQTELHVYSSLVQFTNSHLITPFGKIGIKVWICYHS